MAYTPGTSAYYMRMTTESIQQQVDSHARYIDACRAGQLVGTGPFAPAKYTRPPPNCELCLCSASENRHVGVKIPVATVAGERLGASVDVMSSTRVRTEYITVCMACHGRGETHWVRCLQDEARARVAQFRLCFLLHDPVCIFCRGEISETFDGWNDVRVTCRECERKSSAFRDAYRKSTSGCFGSFALLWRYFSLPPRPVPVVRVDWERLLRLVSEHHRGKGYMNSVAYFRGYYDDDFKHHIR